MTSVQPPAGWVMVGDAFVREYSFDSFARAAEFVAVIGRIADEIDHHPEVSVRHPGVVTVHTTSHDTGTVTLRDVRLAGCIDSAGF